jgi:predicted ATPase
MTIAAGSDRLAFFDRGIIDQVGGLRHMNLPVPQHLLTAAERLRYHEQVFLAPPWREIFANDSERRHGFDEAAASYDALLRAYESFGYRTIVLPKVNVETRADFILEHLGQETSERHLSRLRWSP